MNAAVKGMPICGTQFSAVVAAPATQTLQPSPNAPVDPAVVMADFARRLRDLEKSIKLQVPNDRILSAIALTTDAALISSNKVAIVGEVTFADWHRDVSGNPSGTLDPGITQIRGGVIRTGMIENLAATSWVNLDAAGSTNFIQCGNAIAIGANGHFTFGDATTGRQFSYDGTNIGLGGSVVNLQTGNTLSAIDSNATYGATRSVGDVTASILASSATSITMTSSQLFKSSSGLGGVFIGAGGIFGKDSSGNSTFAIDGATGSATFKGDVNTSGQIVGTGNNTASGYSASVIGVNATGAGNGVVGYSNGGVGVQGIGNGVPGGSFLASGAGVYALSVYGNTGGSYGAYIRGQTDIIGNANITGTLTAGTLSGSLAIGNIAVGGIANFSFSSDGGSTWTPIKLRRDA